MLCFSPVGDKFRIRARQFPALVNCTQFDWFHGWPHEALLSVAQRFLVDIPDIEAPTRDAIAQHMAFVHTEVTAAAVAYYQSARRFCYTTPKSYLELISLYKTLLARKREALQQAKDRLVSGVEKIAQASAQARSVLELCVPAPLVLSCFVAPNCVHVWKPALRLLMHIVACAIPSTRVFFCRFAGGAQCGARWHPASQHILNH